METKNKIQSFVFPVTNQPVRIVTINGEPHWVAKDVCEILGLDNSRQALSRLDEDEKNTVILNDGTPGNPNQSVVTESGLYSLVLASRKPEAKGFKRWVTHEVLPSIRKTGSYGLSQNRVAEILDDPMQRTALMLELNTRYVAEQEKNKILETQAALNAPKLESYRRLECAEGSLCIRDSAKTLGIKEKIFFDHLKVKKWIYQRPGTSGYLAYADKLATGLMEHKTTTQQLPDGTEKVRTQARVTGKGLTRLGEELGGQFFN